ncbi:MAG TPA: hypothetical protein ENI11_03490 [Actinobacteria bacterium]|nr:hypothetical protein [Actinomycetota bacterium]
MSWYQRLGIGISIIGIIANVALAVGAAPLGMIIFSVGALIQGLGIIGYKLVTKMWALSLFFIWLATEALVLSGLLSFFPVTGLIFLILLALALTSAIGATVHYPITRIEKIGIIGSGMMGVILIFYLILVVLFSAF